MFVDEILEIVSLLTRLGLGNDIAALDARNDGALLNGRWLLETVTIDAAQQLLAQVHVIEIIVDLMPGRLDDSLRVHASGTILSYFTSIIPKKMCKKRKVNVVQKFDVIIIFSMIINFLFLFFFWLWRICAWQPKVAAQHKTFGGSSDSGICESLPLQRQRRRRKRKRSTYIINNKKLTS